MKILVTGADGQLGHDVAERLGILEVEHLGIDIKELDITDEAAVITFITNYKPDAVIHCAAYTAVDKAEDERERCYKINVLGTKYIAEACKSIQAKMIYISTDYIFDGEGEQPFKETDKPNPINYYGQTKYEGELEVQNLIKNYFIVRISWVFGVNGNNFVKTMLRLGKEKAEVNVVDDQIGSPTYTYDLARLLVEMIQTDKYGIYHITNEGYCSWFEFACEIFKQAGMNVKVNPIHTESYPTKAKRPKNSRMSKEKSEQYFCHLRNYKIALAHYFNYGHQLDFKPKLDENDEIDCLEKYFIENPVNYKNQNMTDVLVTDLDPINPPDFNIKIRRFAKIILSLAAPNKVAEVKRFNDVAYLKEKEYIFVQLFNVTDKRHFDILDSVFKELIKTVPLSKILFITSNEDVRQYYDAIDVLLVNMPRIVKINPVFSKCKKNKLTLHQKRLISAGIRLFDTALEILERTHARMLFTTQDFHIYDQMFTKAGNVLGITTITHQHGLPPFQHPGLFRFIFSNYIMVWGKSTYESLKEYILPNRIRIIGIDKFNYLLEKPMQEDRKYITIGINPICEADNIEIITNLLSILNKERDSLPGIEELIIKLHPGLNKARWESLLDKIVKTNNIEIKCSTLWVNNTKILHQSRILIAMSSTISLEAMITGCSVIELNHYQYKVNNSRLFAEIPESIINYNQMSSEIHRRLEDESYNSKILIKQQSAIKNEIQNFSIEKEMDFIKTL